ncbi:MAG: glycosyltransferase family 39 protein [Chloroflexi bacterium]|nr:glycosyltransferase family 39 protein [Chloroflexota bacterium]
MSESTAADEIEMPGSELQPPMTGGVIDSTLALTEAREVERAAPRTASLDWRGLAVDLLLVLLVAAGLYFRFSWTNWNQGTDLHPDEYGLTGTLTQLHIPKSLGEYFNTRISPMSPYQKYDIDGLPIPPDPEYPVPDNRMRWGQWPLTIIRFAAEVTGNTDYTKLRLMGRQLSALADSLSLLIIFLIGSRLYNRRVGLLAAALSALAVMQIQQSHFMTADNIAGTFTALTMYFAVRAAQAVPVTGERATGKGSRYRDWLWYVLFGVSFGMALASRINLLPLFGEILAAAFIAYTDRWLKAQKEGRDPTNLLIEAGWRIALAAVFAFIAFRVTQPMSFRAETGDTTLFTIKPNPEWSESMAVAQAESSGIGGGPPGEQWTNRPALIFPFINMVIWGMGLPLGLAAWAGLAWAAWRSLNTSAWRLHLLPLTWAGGYFLFMGTRWVKSVRYFLPIYPFMALFAAWAVYELWAMAKRDKDEGPLRETKDERKPSSIVYRLSSAALFAVVTLGTLTWAWGFTSIYRTDNSRIQASRWIYQNVPAAFNLTLDTADGVYVEPISAPFPAQIAGDQPLLAVLEPRVSGTVNSVTVGHARDLAGASTAILHVVLSANPEGTQPLAQTDVIIETEDPGLPGGTFIAPLGPVQLEKGTRYYLLASGGPENFLEVTGSAIANESWDEGLPLRIEGRDGFGGLYRGLTMEMRWGDDENKRQMIINNLTEVDYLILPSQRAIWSASRLPNAYLMTMEYYRALFDGRLGFDLVAQFQSPITIGPLQISDVAGSVAWGRQPDLPISKAEPWNDNIFSAEEAFSVYDHAPVWVFKKRADFTIEKASAVLYAVDLTRVVNQGPREATAAPTLLMLPRDRVTEQQAGGTWSQMFNRNSPLNAIEPLGVVAWWLTVVLLGWLAFPITFVAFSGLHDRGFAFTRNVSLLLISWTAWLLASVQLLPFTQLTLWLVALALVPVSAFIVWRRGSEIKAWLAENRRYVLIVEILSLGFFVFFLLIRLGNPDLWHPSYGGEKPMDFSYFNAVLKSTSFPPYDPWFAGGYLNYYYYGFVIVATVTKMLGIVPSFAYNLILPMLFSLVGIGAFGVAYNLVASSRKPKAEESINNQYPITKTANPYFAGLAAALLFVALGNLGQKDVIMKALTRAGADVQTASPLFADLQRAAVGAWRIYVERQPTPIGTGEWYWNATRVTPEVTIAEFPFFTFLYADLHAHMIVLSMSVVTLGWIVSLVNNARSGKRPGWLETVALWAIGGLAFGVIQPSNLSDYQTYWLLGGVAIFYAEYLKHGKFSIRFLIDVSWRCILLIGLASVLFRPYTAWRGEGYGAIELWKGDRTPLDSYIIIHGLFLFIALGFLLVETRRWMQKTTLDEVRDLINPALFTLAVFVVFVIGLWLAGYKVAVIALPLVAWTGLLMIRPDAEPERRVTLALFGLGLLLTMVVEVVVAKGDIGRMNTQFKFYLQVWTFLSVASGPALAWVWAQMPEWVSLNRRVWQIALAVLVVVAASYTATAASAKIRDRFPQRTAVLDSTEPGVDCKAIPGMPLLYTQSSDVKDQPHSLDGMDYMQWSAHCDQGYYIPLKYDYDAIRWMQDNVQGSPVIVEVNTPEYRWGSRYTINTGLPGVVGWNWHQRQQRGVVVSDTLVTKRVEDIGLFYSTLDETEAQAFLKKYNVSYIVVGGYELAYYPPESFVKFERMVDAGLLKAAYQNDGVVIYEVVK